MSKLKGRFLWPSQKNSTLYIRTRLLHQKGYCCGEHHLSRRLLVEFSKDFKSWLIKSVFNIWNISISYYGISLIGKKYQAKIQFWASGTVKVYHCSIIESVHPENLADAHPNMTFPVMIYKVSRFNFFRALFDFFFYFTWSTSYLPKLCIKGVQFRVF